MSIKNLPKSLVESASAVLSESTDEPDHEAIDSEVGQLSAKWKTAGVENHLSYRGATDSLHLSSVIVPKKFQRQGVGSLYMKDVKQLADKHNLSILLTPGTDFGASKTGLERFYKGHGFKNNTGGKKDFRFSETMIRHPEKRSAFSPAVKEITPPEGMAEPEVNTLPPVKSVLRSPMQMSPEAREWTSHPSTVKEGGRAVVVYHGTPDIRWHNEGKDFKNADSGIFFTNDPKTANSYADDRRAVDRMEAIPGVIATHLRMDNPFYHDHGGKDWQGTDKIIDTAKSLGHDGVIIRNVVDTYQTNRTKQQKPANVYVVFGNHQIMPRDY